MRSITMINENLKRLSGDSTAEDKSELDVLNEKIDNINVNLEGILQRLSQQPAKKRADKSDKATDKSDDKQDDKRAGDDNGNAE